MGSEYICLKEILQHEGGEDIKMKCSRFHNKVPA